MSQCKATIQDAESDDRWCCQNDVPCRSHSLPPNARSVGEWTDPSELKVRHG